MSQVASRSESTLWSSANEKAGIPDSEEGARQCGAISTYLPAVLLLFAGLAALLVASFMGGETKGQYIVIASPGSTQAEAINLVIASGGKLGQRGRFQNIIIADSKRSDFPDALREAGAWIVVPTPWKGGCFEDSSRGGNT